MAIKLKTPLDSAAARALRAGDMCLLTGELYTARDAAHKRLCTLLEAGQPLPFDMRGAVIYFVGPTPAKPGQAIGCPASSSVQRRLCQCIKKAEVIAYPDLGPEAVRRLYVENFPVTVIIDSEGNNLYEIGRQNYLDSMRQREACGSGV